MKKIVFFVMLVLLISSVSALDDFDSDGMPDSWEKKYNLKYDVNDANEDADDDGLTNLQEYEEGSDPLVPDIKINLFEMVFGFLGEYIVKFLLGIAVLIILYFVVRIISEVFKIKKKKKRIKSEGKIVRFEEEKQKQVTERKPYIPPYKYVPLRQIRKTDEEKIEKAFRDKGFKKKRKHKERGRLTETFEEKPEITEELEALPYSFSKKIGKIKEVLKPGEKKKKTEKKEKKKEEKSVFDRLPKRK